VHGHLGVLADRDLTGLGGPPEVLGQPELLEADAGGVHPADGPGADQQVHVVAAHDGLDSQVLGALADQLVDERDRLRPDPEAAHRDGRAVPDRLDRLGEALDFAGHVSLP
jgi:hypothetical protein